MVQATNKPGLLEKLEELMANLNLCEKALNDYLETKRLAYPRFYFVSSADLLGKSLSLVTTITPIVVLFLTFFIVPNVH